jgi:hypothetical protein
MIANLQAKRKPPNAKEIKERKPVESNGVRFDAGFCFCGLQNSIRFWPSLAGLTNEDTTIAIGATVAA